MLVRVTRSGWTAVFNIDDSKLDEVIDAANRHFGSQDLPHDAGSPRLPPGAPRRDQKRNMGRTRYKGDPG